MTECRPPSTIPLNGSVRHHRCIARVPIFPIGCCSGCSSQSASQQYLFVIAIRFKSNNQQTRQCNDDDEKRPLCKREKRKESTADWDLGIAGHRTNQTTVIATIRRNAIHERKKERKKACKNVSKTYTKKHSNKNMN